MKKKNAGLILRFVQFNTPGFPSPGNIDKYTAANGILPEIVDKKLYAVAWCVEQYYNFDTKMTTEIKLKKATREYTLFQWNISLGQCVLFQTSSLRIG